METFSTSLALCAGNSPVPVNSPHNGQWRGALMFSLICVWINDWVNNREAGDLRRHRGHYDVIVMITTTERNTTGSVQMSWNKPCLSSESAHPSYAVVDASFVFGYRIEMYIYNAGFASCHIHIHIYPCLWLQLRHKRGITCKGFITKIYRS